MYDLISYINKFHQPFSDALSKRFSFQATNNNTHKQKKKTDVIPWKLNQNIYRETIFCKCFCRSDSNICVIFELWTQLDMIMEDSNYIEKRDSKIYKEYNGTTDKIVSQQTQHWLTQVTTPAFSLLYHVCILVCS